MKAKRQSLESRHSQLNGVQQSAGKNTSLRPKGKSIDMRRNFHTTKENFPLEWEKSAPTGDPEKRREGK